MLAILCAKAAQQRCLELVGIYVAASLKVHIGDISRAPRFFAFLIAATGGVLAGRFMREATVLTRWLTASIFCIIVRLLAPAYGWSPYSSREPNP